MDDITTGYFSNHKLNINDLNSLQNDPENFKPQLTLKEAIIDFLRKLLCLDTKSHALFSLNKSIYENHLEHSPIKILTLFDKLLPDDLKDNMSFFIHYGSNDEKIRCIEITCNGKFLKINPEQCWLTDTDKEIIEQSTFNIATVISKADNDLCGFPINKNRREHEEITREDLIKHEVTKLIDEWSIANEYDKKSYHATLITNIYKSQIERFMISVDGVPRLDIPLNEKERELIEITFDEYGENISSNIIDFKISHHYTACPYSEMTKVMARVDDILRSILEGNDYPNYNRIERRNYIEPIVKEIEKLGLLTQCNNIIRRMGVEITSGEGSSESTSQHLSDISKNARLLYLNELNIAFDRKQAGLISNDLDEIKRNIITKKHAPYNPDERIKYIDLIVNTLREKENDFVGKEAEIESGRIKSEIRNINILHEYCERIIDMSENILT
ncbi:MULTISPECIES: hypothetical protein [Yersinia]|uniref:hypothetical protein n=1 Tax=Yersinia TaxID=629 RepID=UPI000FFCBD0C|nr:MULTISPECIES: hypothetical protein [Yersinia]RXA95887.1 hypothetical protein EQP49_12310 [Yersinia sp. 2105 StPb PI]